jgi:hypothetical protein
MKEPKHLCTEPHLLGRWLAKQDLYGLNLRWARKFFPDYPDYEINTYGISFPEYLHAKVYVD